jgi:hypothetical protein
LQCQQQLSRLPVQVNKQKKACLNEPFIKAETANAATKLFLYSVTWWKNQEGSGFVGDVTWQSITSMTTRPANQFRLHRSSFPA